MKAILTLSLTASKVLTELLNDGRSTVHADHPHYRRPLVGSGYYPSYCTKAVDRLKAGPAPIPKVQCKGEAWTDSTFNGLDTVVWSETDSSSYSTYNNYLQLGYYSFDKWSNVFPSINVFDSDGTIHYTEVTQGSAGTCYLMQASSALGEWPSLVKEAFLT